MTSKDTFNVIMLFGFLTLILPFTLIYISFLNKSYYIIRQKGYDPIISSVIIGGTPILVIISAIYFHLILNSFNYNFILFMLVLPCINLLVAYFLPKRLERIYGKRKTLFPYELASKIFLVIFLAIVLYSLVYIRPHFVDKLKFYHFLLLQIILPSIAVYYFFDTRFKLFKKLNIEEIDKTSQKKHVLYIRSFKQDFDVFFLGNVYQNNVSSQLLEELLLFKQQSTIKAITFQQYFIKAFNEKIGNLIGLGNPEDNVPLEGITSSYYTDNNWQNNFKYWAEKAVCIIATPGNTDGLIYELNTIRENGWHEKFFIFIKPTKWSFYKKFYLPILQWSRGVEKNNWQDFSHLLQSAGFHVDIKEPAAGSIIGFNSQFEQIIITSGAINPLSYVTPLAIHLKIG